MGDLFCVCGAGVRVPHESAQRDAPFPFQCQGLRGQTHTHRPRSGERGRRAGAQRRKRGCVATGVARWPMQKGLVHRATRPLRGSDQCFVWYLCSGRGGVRL